MLFIQDKGRPDNHATPRAASLRFGRWRTGLPPEVLKLLTTLLLGALAYAQHAKPFCSGQPHSLPSSSKTLSSYPCSAGAAKRALFIYRNFFGVYSDMLNLGPSDRWVSAQLLFMFLNLVLAVLLPSAIYNLVITTFFTQLFRLLPLAYLLIASYNGIAPSAAGHWYLTQHPFLDLLANIVMPVLPVSECVYGMTAMTLITLIWRRYGDLAGSAGSWHLPADPQGLTDQCDIAGATPGCNSAPVPDAATAAFNAAFRLETSLCYQLLLCSISTVASVALEFWRGKPAHKALRRSVGTPIGVGSSCCQSSSCTNPASDADCAGPSSRGSGSDGKPRGGRRSKVRFVASDSSNEDRCDAQDAVDAAVGTALCCMAVLAATPTGILSDLAAEAQQQPQFRVQPQDPPPQDRSLQTASVEPVACAVHEPLTMPVLPICEGDVPAASLHWLSLPLTHCGTNQALAPGINMAEKPAFETAKAVAAAEAGPAYTSAVTQTTSSRAEPVTCLQQHPQLHPGRCGSRSSTPERRSYGSQAVQQAAAESARGSERGSSSAPLSPLTAALASFSASWHVGRWSNCEPTMSCLITPGATPRGSVVAGGFMMDGDGPEEGDNGTGGRSGGGGSSGVDGGGTGRALGVNAGGSFLALALRQDEFSEGSAPDVAKLDQRRNLASQAGADEREAAGALGPPEGASADHAAAERIPPLSDVDTSPPQPSIWAHGGGVAAAPQLVLRPLSRVVGITDGDRGGGGAVAGADADAAAAAAAAAASMAIQQARRPTYVPRVRLLTTHIKIQGADPGQLGPGYTERLGDVALAQGQRLMGVYVRAGCIELVLDSADWGDSKDSNVGAVGVAVSLPNSGRDSGQLPPPLLLVPPRYRSAPNTPSLLQRQQLLPPQLPPNQNDLQHAGVAESVQVQLEAAQEEAEVEAEVGRLRESVTPPLSYDASPAALSQPLRVWSPSQLTVSERSLERLRSPVGSIRSGASPARVSAPCVLSQSSWGAPDRRGGGTLGQCQGQFQSGGAGGSSSVESTHGSSAGTGVPDLDLGAVIRALRLPNNDGSGDTANDLASELDMDMYYDGQFDGVGVGDGGGASAMDSGMLGGALSSKELSSGSAGSRHAGTGAEAPLQGLVPAAATASTALPSNGLAGATPDLLQRQQGTQSVALLQQQQHPHPQLAQQGQLHQPAPMSSASTVRSISRQALILGGPRNPFAPGIVTLKPRVFATKGPAEIASAAAAAGAAPPFPAGGVRFTAVARRVGAAPPLAAGSFPPLTSASSAPGLAAAPVSDLEFTIRARGEYLRLSASRAGLFPAMVSGGGGGGRGSSFTSSASGMAARGGGGGGHGWSGSGVAIGEVPRASLIDDDVSMEGDGDTPRATPRGGALAHLAGQDDEVHDYGFNGGGGIGGGALDPLADDADADSSGAGGGSGRAAPVPTWYESYSLELLQPPLEPGLLLVDLRPTTAASALAASSSSVSSWSSALANAPPCAVPVVTVSNPAMAAELQAVVDHWEGGASELDDLLLDLGTWVHHVATQASVLLSYSAVEPHPAMQRPRLDARLASLGLHLQAYAEACGWVVTAASLRAELALFGALPSVAELVSAPTAGATRTADTSGVPFRGLAVQEGQGEDPNPLLQRMGAPPAKEPAATPSPLGAGTTSRAWGPAPELQSPASLATWVQPWQWHRRRQGGRGTAPCLGAVATTREAGWTEPGDASARKDGLGTKAEEDEEREFRAYQESCISVNSWIIQLLDVFSMAALLFRGRHENLLSPTNLVTLLACCTGAVTAAAWLVLPYRMWLRLAKAAKIPRHICYCATKFLVGVVGVAAPPGIAAYELGLPVFVFEGLILPWSCVLSPLAATLVAAAKVPLYMALWYRLATPQPVNSGLGPAAATAPPYAHELASLGQGLSAPQIRPMAAPLRLLRALSVSGLSVAVTFACHAYIRSAFRRMHRKQRQAAAAEQQQRRGGDRGCDGCGGDTLNAQQLRPLAVQPHPAAVAGAVAVSARVFVSLPGANAGSAAREPGVSSSSLAASSSAAVKSGKDD